MSYKDFFRTLGRKTWNAAGEAGNDMIVIGKRAGRFAENQFVDTGQKLIHSYNDLRADQIAKKYPTLKEMQYRNERLKAQVEHKKLILQQQAMREFSGMQPQVHPTRQFINSMFGMEQPRQDPFAAGGYRLEYRPKVQKGFKWVKETPMKIEKHSDYIEHPFPHLQMAQHFQHEMAMKYGYKPEIFRVTDRFGRTYFMVVEPRGIKRI